MLQFEFCGMGKVRKVPPVIGGPPNSPFACRVSTTRQGGTGTNCTAVGLGPDRLKTVPSPLSAEICCSIERSVRGLYQSTYRRGTVSSPEAVQDGRSAGGGDFKDRAGTILAAAIAHL